MTYPNLASDVAQRLSAIGQRQGLDMQRLLERHDIRAASGMPVGKVSVDEVASLTQDLWELTDDELFGLGPPAPLGSFALMMRSAIHVPDLRSFLDRIVEASNVLSGPPSMTIGETGAEVSVAYDVDTFDDPDHFIAELFTVVIHRVLGWAIGVRLPLTIVELPWPAPSHVANYEIVFGVHPVFDAPQVRLVLDRRYMDSPVVRDETELSEYLSDQPGVWFGKRDYEVSVSQQVRTILARGLRGVWPTSDEIAGQLNMSTQHLRRLLRAEQTSIGQIKDDVMRDAAVASLQRGEEPVGELATRLGFSETSAFRRAFRRWTGSSPSSFRAGSRP